jgi:hypothetical protein
MEDKRSEDHVVGVSDHGGGSRERGRRAWRDTREVPRPGAELIAGCCGPSRGDQPTGPCREACWVVRAVPVSGRAATRTARNTIQRPRSTTTLSSTRGHHTESTTTHRLPVRVAAVHTEVPICATSVSPTIVVRCARSVRRDRAQIGRSVRALPPPRITLACGRERPSATLWPHADRLADSYGPAGMKSARSGGSATREICPTPSRSSARRISPGRK